ncbi:MAG: hypothetical protein LBB22_05945 [Treponema sp.]|nr:hypothetical protein [Treponema sp.]
MRRKAMILWGGGGISLVVLMSIMLFACKVDTEETVPELGDVLKPVADYMYSILGNSGTYIDTDGTVFRFAVNYNKPSSIALSDSEFAIYETMMNYTVDSVKIINEPVNGILTAVKFEKGGTNAAAATVSIPASALLYSNGSTSAYANTSYIALTIGLTASSAAPATPPTLYSPKGTLTVNLPLSDSEFNKVNNLRATAGLLKNLNNSGTTINDNTGGTVDLLSVGSVGTLISGISPSGSISLGSMGIILSNTTYPATSILPGGTFAVGSLAAGSFTLGTLSGGTLYIKDSGSYTTGAGTVGAGTLSGTVSVNFSGIILKADNLSYTVPPFGVVLDISRYDGAAE